MQLKTILITGTTGYLGTRLSKHFLDEGYNLIALCLNEKEVFKYSDNKQVKTYYLDKTPINKIFEENNIDIIIHTATLYGRNNENISQIIGANVEFPCSILEHAAVNNVKLFINTDTILTKNINAYSMTKSHFADWLTLYSDKIKCVNLKLDHFYGPNDKPIKFIAWIIEQLKNKVEKIDLTEGSQTRDFIYIDDVISAYSCIVANYDKLSGEKVNNFEVGTNTKTKIKDIVIMLKEIMHNSNTILNFGAVPYRRNEVLSYEVNTTGLRLLGWKPVVPVREGLKKIIEIEGRRF